MSSPLVLLLRASRETASEGDLYVAALRDVGFRALCVPVLRFEFTDAPALRERMERPGDYGGLILTSPRAVQALAPFDLQAWQTHPVFVVGPATASAVADLGLTAVCEASGSGGALAERIVAQAPDRPLLFLCGDRRRDELPDRLRAAGLAVEEEVVYRTIGDATRLEAEHAEPPDWIVFFSPSGVEAAAESEVDLADPSWNRARKAAIGPTTAAALRASGMSPAAVAEAPTPAALAAALLSAHRSPDA